jgi:hypothetical protein
MEYSVRESMHKKNLHITKIRRLSVLYSNALPNVEIAFMKNTVHAKAVLSGKYNSFFMRLLMHL